MTLGSHPRISVGLPVYNGEAFLEAAVESLLRQSFQDFELIISDNASTDGTEAICGSLAARDSRIAYRRNPRNLGAAANFNRVVELARGEYFAWANHDDVWSPDYLERCAAALDTDPAAALAYARSAKIDETGSVVAPLMCGLSLDADSPAARLRRYHDLFRAIDRQKGWHHHEIEGLWIPVYGLIRTDLLRRTGLIGTYISSDTVLIEELLMLGPAIEIPETLFFKRDHEGRSMRANVPYDKRMDWFAGEGRKKGFLFPRGRILAERVRAALRAPIPVGPKASAIAEMLSFYVRRPHETKALLKEVLINLRMAFAGGSGGKVPQKW